MFSTKPHNQSHVQQNNGDDIHHIRMGHFILWASIIFLVIAVIWANYATINEVTRGTGRVIPSSQVQVVQNLEGGIVSEILVKEGERVKKGQPLLRIDDTQFSASFRDTQLRISSLRSKIARLTAEASGNEFTPGQDLQKSTEIIANEKTLYQARQNQLNSSIAVLEEEKEQKQQELSELLATNRTLDISLNLANKEYDMKRPLVESGALPKISILEIEREIAKLKGSIEVNEHSIPRARGALKEIDRRIQERKANYHADALSELNDHKVELARLEQSIHAAEDRVRRAVVKSPVAGTIKQINVNTIGGVIQPGMNLVEIVPSDDSLVIEAEVSPSDIAFLHPGQKAIVKLTAYDYAIYGGLEGKLENISADTIVNETGARVYQITVRTNQSYLGNDSDPLPIMSGMAANVDILTGNKTVMDYLLKPIRRARERALRER